MGNQLSANSSQLSASIGFRGFSRFRPIAECFLAGHRVGTRQTRKIIGKFAKD
jgi:hypothetical protein